MLYGVRNGRNENEGKMLFTYVIVCVCVRVWVHVHSEMLLVVHYWWSSEYWHLWLPHNHFLVGFFTCIAFRKPSKKKHILSRTPTQQCEPLRIRFSFISSSWLIKVSSAPPSWDISIWAFRAGTGQCLNHLAYKSAVFCPHKFQLNPIEISHIQQQIGWQWRQCT